MTRAAISCTMACGSQDGGRSLSFCGDAPASCRGARRNVSSAQDQDQKGCCVLRKNRPSGILTIILTLALISSSFPTSAACVAYKVRKGDTLWDVAARHHTTAAKIAKASGIREDAILALGKTIRIPSRQSCKRAYSASKAQAQKPAAPQAVTAAAPKAEVSRSAPARESLIRTALACRGTGYRRGGTSRGGFDCSGFTRYVYAKYGVSLPHSSAAQAGVGSSIPRDQLSAGDLVFFHTYRRGVSHVGIYIGDSRFVHSATYGRGVRVDSLNSGYYAQRYVGARRVKQ